MHLSAATSQPSERRRRQQLTDEGRAILTSSHYVGKARTYFNLISQLQ